MPGASHHRQLLIPNCGQFGTFSHMLRYTGSTKGRTMRILTAILTTAGLLVLAGCNTIEGVGEDLEEAGDEISEESREHQ